MNNLTKRIITALVLASIILFLFLKESNSLILGFLYLVFIVAMYEMLKITKINILNKVLTVILSIFVALILTNNVSLAILVMAISLFWWLINIYIIVNYPRKKPNNFFAIINITLFVTPIFSLYFLQAINGKVLLLLLIVASADIFAYFSGKKFGKHKLAPKVSSGKTIEGLIGGIFGVILVTLFWLNYNNIELINYWRYLLIAIGTGIFSVAGDLYESIYKREVGVKDSGNVLPGHGGVLDRIDGLLGAIPFFIVSTLFLL